MASNKISSSSNVSVDGMRDSKPTKSEKSSGMSESQSSEFAAESLEQVFSSDMSSASQRSGKSGKGGKSGKSGKSGKGGKGGKGGNVSPPPVQVPPPPFEAPTPAPVPVPPSEAPTPTTPVENPAPVEAGGGVEMPSLESPPQRGSIRQYLLVLMVLSGADNDDSMTELLEAYGLEVDTFGLFEPEELKKAEEYVQQNGANSTSFIDTFIEVLQSDDDIPALW